MREAVVCSGVQLRRVLASRWMMCWWVEVMVGACGWGCGGASGGGGGEGVVSVAGVGLGVLTAPYHEGKCLVVFSVLDVMEGEAAVVDGFIVAAGGDVVDGASGGVGEEGGAALEGAYFVFVLEGLALADGG